MLSNTETVNKYHYHLEMENIQGKAVVIVGDAAGAGRMTAVMLAELGAKVFFAARSQEEYENLLGAIRHAGGQGDGVMIDLCRPESARRFFDLAEKWLGRIDVVINYFMEASSRDTALNLEACQDLLMQQAIMHMQSSRNGHIINVGGAPSPARLPEEAALIPVTGYQPKRGLAAALRRQAKELGIRMTLIEPGVDSLREPLRNERLISSEDVARCVYDSLIQPFGVDVIYLHGQYPARSH